jgi:hypothetical protein
LADGHKKLTLFAEKPANLDALTAAELNAAVDASCRILSSDFNVGTAASETVDEKALCVENNAQALGQRNYVFEISSFRFFDEKGQAEKAEGDDIGDTVYQMLKTVGTKVWAALRFTSKKSKEDWGAGDEYQWFEVDMDVPQPADASGYIKAKHVGLVQDGGINLEVVEGGNGGGNEGGGEGE